MKNLDFGVAQCKNKIEIWNLAWDILGCTAEKYPSFNLIEKCPDRKFRLLAPQTIKKKTITAKLKIFNKICPMHNICGVKVKTRGGKDALEISLEVTDVSTLEKK